MEWRENAPYKNFMEERVCAFTGHRNASGLDYNLLDKVIYDLIKTGTKKFISGMALGFDIAAAQSVLAYKKEYDISLVACIPCGNQSARFKEKDKILYNSVLGKCDEVITLSSEYYKGCMQERDRFMVDNCDIVVCYLRRNFGGTFYTVNYARKKGKKIIEL